MATEYQAVAQPPDVRRDYWQDVLSRTFSSGLDVRLDRTPDERDRIVVGNVGPLEVLETRSGPGAAARTARHVRRHDPERLLLFVQAAGRSVGEQLGRSAQFAPGDVGLVDLAAPLRCHYTSRRAIMVSFPKTLSPLRPAEVTRLAGTRIAGAGPSASLVSRLVRQLPRHLDLEDGAQGNRMGLAILDLVHASLATQLDIGTDLAVESQRRALLLECRAYIEQHLGDPGLTPAEVAAAHHVSLRHLHRVFESSPDGVAGLIRRRRLERARGDLLDVGQRDRPVAAIGARWGFADAAHFNRAFKRAYGLPPSAYRREQAALLR